MNIKLLLDIFDWARRLMRSYNDNPTVQQHFDESTLENLRLYCFRVRKSDNVVLKKFIKTESICMEFNMDNTEKNPKETVDIGEYNYLITFLST